MSKPKRTENENLTETITIRIDADDAAQLQQLAARHRLARRGAVAREALRRGMAALREAPSK